MKKKRSKEYKKMMKNYKKVLLKSAKEAEPWDYGFGLDLFISHLTWMRDYYELNENVWGEEVPGHPTRLQILNMILASYKDWMHCDEKYWGWDETDGTDTFMFTTKPTPKETEVHIRKLKNLKYEDDAKNREAFKKEYEYNRKHFFELLGTYIEELWD